VSTLAWFAVAIGALVLHEYLARRTLSRTVYVRWGVLLVLIAAATVAGSRVQTRIAEMWQFGGERAAPFDSTGDPLRLRALAEQHPDHAFPPIAAAETVAAWREATLEALAVRAGLDLSLGDDAEDGAVTVVSSEMVGEIRRTLIRFTSWDGTRIPAYVFDPEGAARKGAILVVPGHGLGIVATAGLEQDYERGAALELARRGYVTLTPELRGFGMLSPGGTSTHRLVAAAALASGSSYKAVVGRDLSRALTVLQRWKGVDPSRLGVTGTSLGAELAVLLGALDPRVRVTVSNSYGGAIGPSQEDDDRDDESEQTPHGCHTVPGINRILVQEDWMRLIAPRPVLVVRGTRNLPREAKEFERLVSRAYQALGAADRFELAVEPGAHAFYVEPTARFFARWL